MSLLPQFTDAARGPVAAQSLLLGLTQITVALTVNALIVTFAGALATLLNTRPTWPRAQHLLMGTVLGALALQLATQRTPASATP